MTPELITVEDVTSSVLPDVQPDTVGFTADDEQMMRVAAGAAFMDVEAPGWWNKINLDEFALANAEHCVIGEVFGHFDDYLYRRLVGQEHEERLDWATAHGFFVRTSNDPDNDDFDNDYDSHSAWLRAESMWRQTILERRQADGTTR